MERYEKYKDSGVEWIGDIPDGWEVSLLKRFSKVTDGSHFSPKSQLTGRPYVSVKDVGVNYIDLDNCNKISEDDFLSLVKNGCSPKVGDVLLTKDGTIGRAAVVTKEHKQFVVLSSLGILSPKNKVCSDFLYLYLISGINIDQMYSTIHGSALTRLTIEKINNLIFVCPPKPAQTAIANYLDRKTAEIDELIAQKERLFELYEEEKTAIINQAVTKGIDPDVKLKDSGIDWLDEIPEGWEVLRLRYLAKIKTGEKDTENREDDAEYPFYVRSQTIERISSYSYDGEAILTAGDGVGVGKVFHYVNGKFDYHQRVYKISDFGGIMAKYLFYYMKLNFHKEVIRISAKSTVDSLRLPMLQNFPVCFPNSTKQQTAIVHHIETETVRINTKITKTKRIIELQKEYRTALISEVVTGKIKVTEEAAS